MSQVVLLHLGGDPAEARRCVEQALPVREAEVISLADAVRRPNALRNVTLALVGNPPADEIGFGLAVLTAVVGRPARVALVAREGGSARVASRRAFLRTSLAPAIAQILTGAVAVATQRALAAALVRSAPVVPRRTARLCRAVYVRPLVGIPSAFGGSVTHTLEVIHALRQTGVGVGAFTTDPAIAGADNFGATGDVGWKLLRIPRAFRALPASVGLGGDLALLAAARSARRGDALYQRHTRFSLAGALLSRLSRRPLILEYNGSEAFFGSHWQPTPFARQLLACEDAILAAAAFIVVVAEIERDLLVRRGVDAGRVLVNPNGVDATRFEPGSGRDVRRALGFADGDVVIGFLGSFGPWHGAPLLARAFAELSRSVPNAALLLLGDGPEREEVESILTRAGLRNRVVLAGRISPAGVPKHLDACDILASPHVPLPGGTDFFGSPTKLFEYMASGRAIAASALGQIADVLDDGETALLVPPGDEDALVGALTRLARDPELRERLGAAARRAAIERHSWVRNAEQVSSAFAARAAAC